MKLDSKSAGLAKAIQNARSLAQGDGVAMMNVSDLRYIVNALDALLGAGEPDDEVYEDTHPRVGQS
jgi:hypothetical protein